MTRPLEEIRPLIEHPDAEALRQFDHPARSLKRWVGVLTAEAWVGADLACFFTEAERGAERYVLIFKPANAYMAALGGGDMREAEIGAQYELSVFVSHGLRPVVDRAERIDARPRWR